MTPSEMLALYNDTGDSEFLSELEGDDLWAFLTTGAIYTTTFVPFEVEYKFRVLVAEEAKREREADFDIWNNLLALDLEIKQDWINDLTEFITNTRGYPDSFREIYEYLKERKWK